MEKPFLFVDVTNPTWLAYVAFLVIAVYFRFTRLFTVRNLDLILLLTLSTAIVVEVVSRRDAEFRRIQATVQKSVADFETAGYALTAPETLREVPTDDPLKTPDSTPAVEPAKNLPSSDRNQEVADSTALTAAQEPESSRTGSADSLAAGSVTENTIPAASVVQQAEAAPAESQSTPLVESAAGESVSRWATWSLIAVTLALIVRLLFDESLTRRPRLDQNLNAAGLTFLCVPAFAILMIAVLTRDPLQSTVRAVEHGRALLQRRDVPVDPGQERSDQPAPTETLIAAGGAAVAQLSGNLPKPGRATPEASALAEAWLARILVVVAHSFVVAGLMIIGRQHFASIQIGVAMSCLYLLLPCTAVNVHELNHVLPAACLVWAIASYRNPIVAGVLLGLASGTLFFAAFLLPLWAVFYGRRGALRFAVSVLGITIVLITTLMMISGDTNSFINKLVSTANWTVYRLLDDSAPVDSQLSQLFVRIPMAAVFFVMLTAMTVLPRPRNLENLLANSTCLVVAAQMWYPDDVASYVLWYLPLFLIVIFRPRLDRFTPPEVNDPGLSSQVPVTPTASREGSVVMSRLSFLQQGVRPHARTGR